MDLIVFQREAPANRSFEEFLDSLRSRNLTFLASSMLEEGLGPADIVEAVKRATTVCHSAGVPVEEHFKPVYTSYRNSLIRDCKLSKFGYLLTLINARPDRRITAHWQTKLLEDFL
jgi:hypothetical protein